MKLRNISFILLLTVVTGLLFSGCKKDDDDETTPAPTPNAVQRFGFHMHSMVGSSAAAYGTTFTDNSGRKFNLADFRFYISNVVLIKDDGSEYPFTNKVILVNPTTNEYDLGDAPVGSYKGFKFILGLDSATNHSDPTIYPASNPLSIQSPSIHWTWNSGYIFMKVEGQVDTTLANTGTPNYDFFYHIGMDMFKRNIDFSTEAFTIVSGSDKEIGLEFDLLEMLSNVDMRTENETHTMNNMPLATKIADNWSSAFTIE